MGNANGREDGVSDGGGADEPFNRSDGGPGGRGDCAATPPPNSNTANDLMSHTPPESPGRARSPLLFASQVPIAPIHRGDGTAFYNQMRHQESHTVVNSPMQRGIPIIITWDYGGNDVAVEGSWDNWISRKKLQRSGKDHSILMVLPSGIYHYRFIVDGKQRYAPDLPSMPDEMGNTCNLLNVHDYVPEILNSVTEFEAPPSPDLSYGQVFPAEEDYAKEPHVVPPQLHLTVLGMDDQDESSSSKPRHVVLNHVFIEKGCASKSVVALGLSHRFQSKYVTLVLYKPLKR